MKILRFLTRPLFGNEYDVVILIARVFIGVIMLTHGLPKLMNFSETAASFPDPIGFGSSFALFLAICAEVGCSLLLILGLFTRLAALILVINMIVAIATAGKEIAVMYLAFYVLVFLFGGGKYSVDYLIYK